MNTWKLTALALAMCAAAGSAIAAGTPSAGANTSATTAAPTAPPAASAPAQSMSPAAPSAPNAASADAQAACASYVGRERTDCLRNYDRLAMDCKSLTDSARSDCMRTARAKAASESGAAMTGDAVTTPSAGVTIPGNSRELGSKLPAKQ